MSSADAVQKLSVLVTEAEQATGPAPEHTLECHPGQYCVCQAGIGGKSNPLGEVLQSTAEFVYVLQTIALKPSSPQQTGSRFQSLNSDPNTLSTRYRDRRLACSALA
ncbi:hypothetical protein N7516_002171 [Penicillium verrucosum]|uniref:uncharacterized protein n=1 Tax=Penicillium verrucosum TaxID=60171 RepID=UPI002544F4E0|nr:uncharacterized protein N7516_002171 [Penicillium verrucosum]KAJ5942003.1 hypothetical protein N7516_002171 [Penicillium verrucosum]